MAIRKKDVETPKDYFYRVYNAQKEHEKWAAKIPCDSIVFFADTGQEVKVNKLIAQQRNKCYEEIK